MSSTYIFCFPLFHVSYFPFVIFVPFYLILFFIFHFFPFFVTYRNVFLLSYLSCFSTIASLIYLFLFSYYFPFCFPICLVSKKGHHFRSNIRAMFEIHCLSADVFAGMTVLFLFIKSGCQQAQRVDLQNLMMSPLR